MPTRGQPQEYTGLAVSITAEDPFLCLHVAHAQGEKPECCPCCPMLTSCQYQWQNLQLLLSDLSHQVIFLHG